MRYRLTIDGDDDVLSGEDVSVRWPSRQRGRVRAALDTVLSEEAIHVAVRVAEGAEGPEALLGIAIVDLPASSLCVQTTPIGASIGQPTGAVVGMWTDEANALRDLLRLLRPATDWMTPSNDRPDLRTLLFGRRAVAS